MAPSFSNLCDVTAKNNSASQRHARISNIGHRHVTSATRSQAACSEEVLKAPDCAVTTLPYQVPAHDTHATKQH